MATAHEELTPEVHAFVEREGLTDALRFTLTLVHEHFPDARRVSGEIVRDPDACDEWIALNVDVPVGARELMPRDDAFIAEWVRGMNWPAARGLTVMIYAAADGSA